MRQSIALLLVLSLLLISSVPSLVEAASCPLGGAELAMQHDASEMQMSGDSDGCQLECACGCHRSVDSLPQLLAPHAASQQVTNFPLDVGRAGTPEEEAIELVVAPIPVPPPRLIRS